MFKKKYQQIFQAGIAAASFVLASSSFANPALQSAKDDVATIRWPQAPRTAIGATEYYTTFDGIQVPMLSLQAGKLSIELSKRKSMSLQNSDAKRYSGEFTDSQLPGISIGLSVFNSKEFLPDLSDASWTGYKIGLTKDRPDIKVVFENSNIESPTTPYVFGAQFRQIAYEQESNRGIIKRREIFSYIGDTLLVFTINGSKASVDQNWGAAEHLISEMSLH